MDLYILNFSIIKKKEENNLEKAVPKPRDGL